MTFEEMFAEQGRKLDAMKEKIANAAEAAKLAQQQDREELAKELAELDAAMDELDASIDAKIQKQEEKMDAQINKQFDAVDEALDQAGKSIENSVNQVKEGFARFMAPLDKGTADKIANAPAEMIDRVEAGTQESYNTVQGEINAVKENMRLAGERSEEKRNAVLLRAQMSVENAKDKVAERKEALDKAGQEAWIMDLLDYADRCQEYACAWAMEAEYTMIQVADEIKDYNEKYGK